MFPQSILSVFKDLNRIRKELTNFTLEPKKGKILEALIDVFGRLDYSLSLINPAVISALRSGCGDINCRQGCPFYFPLYVVNLLYFYVNDINFEITYTSCIREDFRNLCQLRSMTAKIMAIFNSQSEYLIIKGIDHNNQCTGHKFTTPVNFKNITFESYELALASAHVNRAKAELIAAIEAEAIAKRKLELAML